MLSNKTIIELSPLREELKQFLHLDKGNYIAEIIDRIDGIIEKSSSSDADLSNDILQLSVQIENLTKNTSHSLNILSFVSALKPIKKPTD
jgi:hypothetical protein